MGIGMKKTVYVLLLASTSALALVSTVASVAFWNRMRALERHAVENAQKEQKPEAKPETKTEKRPDKEKPSAHIMDFQFDGSAIEMRFDRQPEAGDVLRYVWISPKVEEISVECRQCRWWGVTNWTVRLASPDFRYRTQYTMVVKREMPFADGCELKQDFRRTFMRPDEIPAARFADSGRYLPPVGEKTLAVETVNISNLACFARYVPPENIVAGRKPSRVGPTSGPESRFRRGSKAVSSRTARISFPSTTPPAAASARAAMRISGSCA